MVLNQQEQEIFDKIKHFLRSYGLPLGLGLTISLGSVLAWNGYSYYQTKQRGLATNVYQRFLQIDDAYKEVQAEIDVSSLNEAPATIQEASNSPTDLGATNINSATPGATFNASNEISATSIGFLYNNMLEIADVLKEEFPSQSYTAFATMRIAALDAMNGNITSATNQLQWVVKNVASDRIASLASVMLSRSLLAEKKYDEALAILASNKVQRIELAEISEIRGDIYYARGDYQEARTAYEDAATRGGENPRLKYKLLRLPATE